jgi:hypothetical protein
MTFLIFSATKNPVSLICLTGFFAFTTVIENSVFSCKSYPEKKEQK